MCIRDRCSDSRGIYIATRAGPVGANYVGRGEVVDRGGVSARRLPATFISTLVREWTAARAKGARAVPGGVSQATQ
eukprot:13788461-Alexandrium_andersonii.AAC.1